MKIPKTGLIEPYFTPAVPGLFLNLKIFPHRRVDINIAPKKSQRLTREKAEFLDYVGAFAQKHHTPCHGHYYFCNFLKTPVRGEGFKF